MTIVNGTHLDNGPAPTVPTPGYVSQATAVEQSRAAAEVQAAVLVAQSLPRSIDVVRSKMRAECEQYRLADKAFYRYKRGKTTINDATVHLARTLARCYGNLDYGIAELRRDLDAGHSEMKAWAWDQETNARASTTFIVPHARDKTDQDGNAYHDPIIALRDVYENNANQGGRRVRQMIFNILPSWLVEEAKDICRSTLEKGDGRPLPERIDAAIGAFAANGIDLDQIEQKLGRNRDKWDGYDLAQLTIVHRSLTRGEVTVDEEFPPRRVTTDEIETANQAPVPTAEQAAPLAADDAPEPPATDHDPKVLEAELRAAVKATKGVTITALTKHFEVGTLDALTADEALASEALQWISEQ